MNCFVFQCATRTGRVSSTRHLPGLKVQAYYDEDYQNLDVGVSRRETLWKAPAAIFTVIASSAAINPQQSHAAETMTMTPATTTVAGGVLGGATQSARVEEWPGIDALEPMYEFKLSVDAIVIGLQDTKNWPYIQKRLEKFFGGFIVNEKNFYFGVGLQYMNDVKYDKGELPNYVLLDKQARYNALEVTMNTLETLKNNLNVPGIDPTTINDYATTCQSSLASWFDLIPDGDMKAVLELFTNVQKADINRDGRLSDNELVCLSPVEQEIWKKRVSKFG